MWSIKGSLWMTHHSQPARPERELASIPDPGHTHTHKHTETNVLLITLEDLFTLAADAI